MNIKDICVCDWIVDTRGVCRQVVPQDFEGSNTLNGCNAEWFLPVTLTPSVLEKNGFVKTQVWGGESNAIYEYKYEVIEKKSLSFSDSSNLKFDKIESCVVEADDEKIRKIHIKVFNLDGAYELELVDTYGEYHIHELQHAFKQCKMNKDIDRII